MPTTPQLPDPITRPIPTTPQMPYGGNEMRMVWHDEGDGPAGTLPRSDLWDMHITDQWQNPTELQEYTRDARNASYNGNGSLVITASKMGSLLYPYTSARLHGKFVFQYGEMEALIRVPKGIGTWPALWLLGDDSQMGWPRCGEIDVMEIPVIANHPVLLNQGIHGPNAMNGDKDTAVGVPPITGIWSDDYHLYTVLWKPGTIEFFVDGDSMGKITRAMVESKGGEWVYDNRPMHPIVNLAIGGWAGEPDSTWTAQQMLIDWVRIYQ